MADQSDVLDQCHTAKSFVQYGHQSHCRHVQQTRDMSDAQLSFLETSVHSKRQECFNLSLCRFAKFHQDDVEAEQRCDFALLAHSHLNNTISFHRLRCCPHGKLPSCRLAPTVPSLKYSTQSSLQIQPYYESYFNLPTSLVALNVAIVAIGTLISAPFVSLIVNKCMLAFTVLPVSVDPVGVAASWWMMS